MKRLFYYSGHRLTVFHWQHEKCIASYIFDPDETGLEKFTTYLQSTKNTPARILVDLIEEDFKKENIPHVSISDRKAIINRLIDRHYRKSKDYVNYKVIGREKQGRKDDIVLYSVLSNPEILEFWLKPIKDNQISISGIWSLPLLSETLFNKLKINADNVLLVSQQVPSNLRQTFIKKGKFENSRSAVVNLHDSTIGEYISTEIEQTIRFLSNQRHIGFDEKIEIHIICREEDLSEIQTRCTDTPMRTFKYHSILDIQDKIGYSISPEAQLNSNIINYSNCIYSYICASLISPFSHYGPRTLFSKFHQQIVSSSLITISLLTIISSILLSLSIYSDTLPLEDEILTINHQTESVNKAYKNTLEKIEFKLEKSQAMKSSVLLANKIKEQLVISPQKFMSDISKLFSKYHFANTEITKLSWKQYQKENITPTDKNIIDYAKNDTINQYAVIGGYIHISKISLKKSVEQVNAMVDVFKNSKSIKNVNIKRIPIDIRSASSIENESGNDIQDDVKSDKSKGQFEIEILMSNDNG